MKLSKLNKTIEEDKIFGNFVSALEKFVVENNYCHISLEFPKDIYNIIFNVIRENSSEGFYAGKVYEWKKTQFYINEAINENCFIINGNNKKVIIKLR